MNVDPRQIENLKGQIKEISEISYPYCEKGNADLVRINNLAHQIFNTLSYKLAQDPNQGCPICKRHGGGHLGVCQD